MRLGVGYAEADRDDVEERRVSEFGAPTAKIVRGMEDELELAGARLVTDNQGLVGAAVGVGHDIGDELAVWSARQLVKLHSDALRRLTAAYVEDMGRNAGQILLLPRFKRPLAERAISHPIVTAKGRPMRFLCMQV